MARVLIIHGNEEAQEFLEERAGVHHVVKTTDNWTNGIKAIARFRPNLLIAEMDPRNMAVMGMLRHLKRSHIRVSVVLVGPAGAGALQPMAMRLGAAAFVEYPMEQSALDRAISQALQSNREARGDVLPISTDELGANLSELERQLNRRMVCVAGRNQVYIQSLILGGGMTSKPRIALKCPLRKQFGYPPDVYYEYIRDICCGEPSGCPAQQEFAARNSA